MPGVRYDGEVATPHIRPINTADAGVHCITWQHGFVILVTRYHQHVHVAKANSEYQRGNDLVSTFF